MTLPPGTTLPVFLLRCNGALVDVYTDESQCVTDMRARRRNGEFWRIEKKTTVPHQPEKQS